MASKPIAHNLNSKWRSQDVKIQESADFTSLLLSNKVLAGLKRAGYQSPSPIQIEAIPVGRFGKDLVVQAKSGTGKTLVFSIVALEMILPDVTQPQVLIIAPTREIAHQICSVVQAVGHEFENLNCCTFIGGIPISDDKENISGCQIAVGTPGRIKQLIKEGILKTNCIRLFVLDEADQLLEASFLCDVDAIFLTLPKDKQVIATSATYPQKLKKLADRYFRNPYLARLNIDELALLGIVHYVQTVDVSDMPMLVYRKKLEYLAKILTSITFSQCLVFCNLLSRVPTLTSDIKDWGFTTTSISSNKEQVDRLKAIDKLKLFKCKVLVSSDLTARGIDAENVNLVVNFDLPHSVETYLHRVGRAGRYGSRGLAVTLLLPNQSEAFKEMERSANFSSFDLPDPIPQNLMNISPQRLEDGFDESSEKSELPDECVGNQDDASSVNETADFESVEADLNQRQNELCDAMEEMSFEKSEISDSYQSEKRLNDELSDENVSSLQSVQEGYGDSAALLEQNGLGDENGMIGSPINSKSENPSKSDVKSMSNIDSSSSGVNENVYAGITSFLAQIQPSDSSTDIISPGNQANESADSFYYQIFKSFADENMPEVQSNNDSNLETTMKESHVGDHEVHKFTGEVSKRSESASSNSSHSNLDGSDSDSPTGIIHSYSSNLSLNSEPLPGLFNQGMKLPFQSDFMVKGANGWKEVKLEKGPMNVVKNLGVQEESNSVEKDQASVHSVNNEVPQVILEENVHSRPSPAFRNLECNPLPPAPSARPGPSRKSAKSVANGNSLHSHSSPNYRRGNRDSKGPRCSDSQDYRANHARPQRARELNPLFGIAQVQDYPNGNLQPEANATSRRCQNTYDARYNNSYANSHNCSQHRSCNACSHTNRQTFQNNPPYESGNHSHTYLWHDIFSKQLQHINNMCYFHQYN